jgi:hypothetical protein
MIQKDHENQRKLMILRHAAEPLQYAPDLLLGRMVNPGRRTVAFHYLLGRRQPRLGFLSHLQLS